MTEAGDQYRDQIDAARGRGVNDCGCPDIYYCPSSDGIERPRHSGFSVCCDRLDLHVPVRSL